MPFDFIGNLSRRNINQGRSLFQPQPMSLPVEEEESDISIPEQETPILSRYSAALDRMPDRSNYKNPLIQKILAGVAGTFSDNPYGTTRGILDAPYERDVENWKQRVGVLGEQAGIETRTNQANLERYKILAEMGDKKSQRLLRAAQVRNYEDQISKREDPSSKFARDRVAHRTDRLFDIGEGLGPDRRVINYEPTGRSSVRDLNDPKYNVDLGQTSQTPGQRADLTVSTHERTRATDVANPLRDNYIPARQEIDATNGAIRNIMLKNPNYTRFIQYDQVGNALLKPADDVWGPGGPSETENSAYQNFAKEVETEKQRILGQKRAGGPNNPNIELDKEAKDFLIKSGDPNPSQQDIDWLKTQPKPW